MENQSCVSFIISIVLILSFVSVSVDSHACTGIFVKTEDGNYIQARTMEFGYDQAKFDLLSVPRNYSYTGQTPSGKPGLKWKTKYAYVGFNPYGADLVADGLNEKGVACGIFYFPGYAKYQDLPENDYSRAVSCYGLASWILSNCANVSEVREQLPKIIVCGVEIPQMGGIPPFHYLVSDAAGDSIIIEYVNGELNIHDNEVGALTNSPVYDWHITNLRNYIGLKTLNDPSIKIDGKEFAGFGQGTGGIGLPGDFTPPSRFVRAVFLNNTVYKGKNVDEGIAIAFHILNQFDIPVGSVRADENDKIVSDSTLWTSASDLTNRRYFYHTYNDRSVRVLAFEDLDLNAPGIKMIKDVQKPGKIENVADQLK